MSARACRHCGEPIPDDERSASGLCLECEFAEVESMVARVDRSSTDREVRRMQRAVQKLSARVAARGSAAT